MFEKVKNKIILVLGAIAGILYLLFRIEKSDKEKAETKLLNADFQKEDAVLKEKQDEAKREIEDAKAEGEAEKAKKLSKEEMEEALKKL